MRAQERGKSEWVSVRPGRKARLQDDAGGRPDHGLLPRRLHGRRRRAAGRAGQADRETRRRRRRRHRRHPGRDRRGRRHAARTDGFRGAVLLGPGTFTCAETITHPRQRRRPARQRQRGRRSGPRSSWSASPTSRSPYAARGPTRAPRDDDAAGDGAAGRVAIADAYVPSGATVVHRRRRQPASPSATPWTSAGR